MIDNDRLELDGVAFFDKRSFALEPYVQVRRMYEQARARGPHLAIHIAYSRFGGYLHRSRRIDRKEIHAKDVRAGGVCFSFVAAGLGTFRGAWPWRKPHHGVQLPKT